MKKIDKNQPMIVRDLRKMGCSVQSLAEIGKGVPDLLVGWKGKNFLFEVKDGMLPPSRQRLTPDEKVWHALWQESGQVHVIKTTEDAIKIMSNGGNQ